MAAVETSLAVSQRVRGCTHLAEVIVGPFVQIADHLEVEIKHFVEIAVLGTGFCQDHRKMKGNGSDVETSDKDRFVVLICRLHASALVPRAKESTASHRADDSLVFLVHLGDVALAAHRQPVRIHGFRGTVKSCLKDIFCDAALSVNCLVI